MPESKAVSDWLDRSEREAKAVIERLYREGRSALTAQMPRRPASTASAAGSASAPEAPSEAPSEVPSEASPEVLPEAPAGSARPPAAEVGPAAAELPKSGGDRVDAS